MAPLGRSAQVLMGKSKAKYKTVGCVIINNGSMGRCFSDRPAQLHSIFLSIFTLLEKDLLIWLHQVLAAARRVFTASWGIFHCSTWTLVVALWLSSCAEASGNLVPRPGIEPKSPALPGRFLTTAPPGKSLGVTLCGHLG